MAIKPVKDLLDILMNIFLVYRYFTYLPPDPVQMELDADLDSNPAYKVCGFETTVIKNYFKFFFLSCYIELIKRKLITVILVLYYSL